MQIGFKSQLYSLDRLCKRTAFITNSGEHLITAIKGTMGAILSRSAQDIKFIH